MAKERQHVTDGTDCWCVPEVIHVSPASSEPQYGDLNHGPASKTPETVEVNVVMGAQLRAIVRSALLHVKNKLREEMDGNLGLDAVDKADIEHVVDKELVKWPLSAEPEDTLAQWLYKRFGTRSWPLWDNLSEEDRLYWEHEAAAVRRAVGRGGFKSAKKEPGMLLSTPINALHRLAKDSTEVRTLRPLDLKNAEDLGEAIRIAVGAASTCWSNMMNTGVFKEQEALDIATQLEHHVSAYLRLLSGQVMERHQKVGDQLEKYRTAGMPMVSVSQVLDILCGRANPEEYETALQPRPAQFIGSERVRCWCGGEVGLRTPGDENGLGCMRSITHNWKGVAGEMPPRHLDKPAPRTPGFDGPEGTEWEGGKAR